MSKKLIRYFCIPALVLSLVLFNAPGCDLDDSTALTITKSSGVLAVTTWFSFDNPSVKVKNHLITITDSIIDSYDQLSENDSYVDVVYPKLCLYIDNSDIDINIKQLVKSGCIVILSGLDEMMSSNEKIKKNRDIARRYVEAFCSGVKCGLSLASTDPSLQRSAKAYSLRLSLQNE